MTAGPHLRDIFAYFFTSSNEMFSKFIQIRIMENLGIWVGSDIWTSFTTGKTTIQPMTLVGQAKIATIFLEILIVHCSPVVFLVTTVFTGTD